MTTTLADHLRSLSDEALGELLKLRPDLVMPVPPDLDALAARAQSRVSVTRALDSLDQFTLEILDATRLARDAGGGVASLSAVLALAKGVDAAAVRAAIDRLRARVLVYGPDQELRVAAGVDEVSSPYPAGLGRPAAELDAEAAALCTDAARLRRTLLAAPPPARAVLDRLAAGPPVGTLSGSRYDPESPVRWLVEHRLLVPIPTGDPVAGPAGAVELPREIGLLLRRESPLGPVHPTPPPVTTAEREPAAVDATAAGQAMEVVRQTSVVVDALTAEPVTVLRSGGIGVRDLRRLARVTGLSEPVTALLLEVAYAAGLIGEDEIPGTGGRAGSPEQHVLPTTTYDLWRASPLAQRWDHLARAWLAMPRQPGLIGQRDERNRLINALSPEVERTRAPFARREVLTALAELPAGAAPEVEELLALVQWRAPRRGAARAALHREALAEATTLGLIALGALASYARALLDEIDGDEPADDDPLGVRADNEHIRADASAAARALDAFLPRPVDHVLVQADLTVVVPGPPEPTLAAELDLVAEPESAGAASVFRVTEASVRAALDAGYAAEDLHELFRRRSRTPIPQTLTYLIDDVARRHGGLRVGSAGAYLRSDDEALLTQVLADRRLAGLSLRRLAPTVVVSPHPLGRVLTALREAGYPPVAEDATGAAVLAKPRTRRAPARTPLATTVAVPKLSGPRLLALVEQLRRGDAAARAARRAPESVRAANGRPSGGPGAAQAHREALAVLQQALRDRARVWVGYVDAHGATASRLVRPVSIGGGYLRAEDERTQMLHTFALHRVTAAVLDE
ncbi:MAG TPA: helicase-associated domain-containing protein [Micromonospora sp.]